MAPRQRAPAGSFPPPLQPVTYFLTLCIIITLEPFVISSRLLCRHMGSIGPPNLTSSEVITIMDYDDDVDHRRQSYLTASLASRTSCLTATPRIFRQWLQPPPFLAYFPCHPQIHVVFMPSIP